jgi:hypothetical protein
MDPGVLQIRCVGRVGRSVECDQPPQFLVLKAVQGFRSITKGLVKRTNSGGNVFPPQSIYEWQNDPPCQERIQGTPRP